MFIWNENSFSLGLRNFSALLVMFINTLETIFMALIWTHIPIHIISDLQLCLTRVKTDEWKRHLMFY